MALVIVAAPAVAVAHDTQVQANIHVTLHINPDDKPLAGQTAQIEFIFSDELNKFKPADCDCQLTIQRDNQPVFSGQLISAGDGFSRLDYTFSQSGGYQLLLKAAPRVSGEFPAFNSQFAVNVAKSPRQIEQENSDRQKQLLILGGLIALSALSTVGLLARLSSRSKLED